MSWRALLFVPADSRRLVASAVRREPDAVILDLEDGVAPGAKDVGRTELAGNQARLVEAGIDVIVRINAELPSMVRDMDAIDPARVVAVMVPKCVDTRGLVNAAELLDALGSDAGLVPLVESPAALSRLAEIAAAPRVLAMMFGPEDYAAALGVEPVAAALEIPAALLVAAAAAHGVPAFGLAATLADFANLETYAARVARARGLGFSGAAAIHPSQLPVLRAGFAPTEEEIARARRTVEAFEAAGGGAVALDGAMLDAPIVARARRLLGGITPNE